MPENAHFETLAIHAGQLPDPVSGAVTVPIYQTATYAQAEVGVHKGYEYSRTGNPTRTALEIALAALECSGLDVEGRALAFSSGMAATDTLLRLLQPGDEIVAGNDVYGGTFRLFQQVYAGYGIRCTYVDMSDFGQLEAALTERTRLVWLETPTNPLMKVFDLSLICSLIKTRKPGTWVAVDNTFASPYLQQPLKHGADFVVYSTTKYLGGHSDVVGGAIVTINAAAYEKLKFLQNAVGAVPGPQDCWLVLRGLKTLSIRMQRHSENAAAVCTYLARHNRIERILYPGIPTHPGYETACRQMRLFGGMLSVLVKDGEKPARDFVSRTRVFTLAESLGGVESLIELPAAMTHLSVVGSPLEVPRNLVRLSVGIEHIDDLLEDLEQALR